MPRHTATTEPTQVERLTRNALAVGRTALANHGPAAAVAAMQPWAEALVKAQRKAERRAVRAR